MPAGAVPGVGSGCARESQSRPAHDDRDDVEDELETASPETAEDETIETANDYQHETAPEPEVRRLAERVQEQAPAIRRPAADQPSEEKKSGGFSLFGLRKPAGQDSREKPEQEQQPQQTQRPNVRVASGDLFNGMDDDDLEIPAFLRRQAN